MNHQHQSQNPAQASSKASGEGQRGISKPEYHQARRLVREYGRAAFALLAPGVFHVMDRLQSMHDRVDPLTERAAVIAYCKHAGIPCDVSVTRSVPLVGIRRIRSYKKNKNG
jgi:hypothetical protein